ncbi:hypothetical protein [Bavariicoccus seileri]|uniref:hypothetical protein n=1 Tax=Bavariicoccus seileri TaxID=549685 RepID=UPI003F8E7F00
MSISIVSIVLLGIPIGLWLLTVLTRPYQLFYTKTNLSISRREVMWLPLFIVITVVSSLELATGWLGYLFLVLGSVGILLLFLRAQTRPRLTYRSFMHRYFSITTLLMWVMYFTLIGVLVVHNFFR